MRIVDTCEEHGSIERSVKSALLSTIVSVDGICTNSSVSALLTRYASRSAKSSRFGLGLGRLGLGLGSQKQCCG